MSTNTTTDLRLQWGDGDEGWSAPTSSRWPDDDLGMADALSAIEKFHNPERYRIVRVSTTTDVEPIEPPDPFTPGSVWYAKETFTTRTGHAIKRGKRVAVTVPRYPADLQPGEVAGVVGTALGVNYLPKDKLVAERPEPLVVVPETPTLGWLAYDAAGDRGRVVGSWYRRKSGTVFDASNGAFSPEYVTAFTKATAVPTDALDELLAEYRKACMHQSSRVALAFLREGIATFFAAVDAAGEGK